MQIFFISFHLLLSYVAYEIKNQNFYKSNILKAYFVLLIPFFLSLVWNGDAIQISEIKKAYSELSIPSFIAIDSMAGNFNYILGGFLKHFILYNYINFVNLFLAFLLSIFIFLLFFIHLQYRIF